MASRLPVLKKRSAFLAAHRHGRKLVTKGFLLQVRKRPLALDPGVLDDTIRVGFTASKKVGNAVCRSRAKRRLRALAHGVLRPFAKPGRDYVLIARPETLTLDFSVLTRDLINVIKKTEQPEGHKSGRHRPVRKHSGKKDSGDKISGPAKPAGP